MSLTNREMARLGELLDEVLPMSAGQRRTWLESLSSADQPLLRPLRDALLAEETGASSPLDRLPHIETGGAEEEAAAGHHAGERLGAYELLQPLGSGGMADVWLACRTDGAFERQVALKIPRLQGRPAEMTARFALECNILATLEYPGIARLYDAGVDASGVPYIAMEYVQGEPLVAWCDARGLDRAARTQVFLQVLDVVAVAHGRQVIHRDLKPSNILVTGEGEVRLLDFGIARLLQPATGAALLTRAYGLALTPEYASPELLRGEAIDSRSDIYSLGVVLHELLTGARPVQTTPPATGDTTRLHGALREVVTKALQPDPAERYPDAASFAKALRPFADARAHNLPSRIRIRPLWVAGLATVATLIAMATLLNWTVQQRSQERWAREDALPGLQALIASDDYAAAFDLAREIERLAPRDPVLRELEPSFAAKVRLDTSPQGARVFYRPYAAGDEDWRPIGETPLVDVAAPLGVGLWRIEKEGHDSALLALRNPGLQLGNSPDADLRHLVKDIDLTIPLAEAATSPHDMVLVPAIPGLVDFVDVPAFFIDRFEVRNRHYQEFVDAGGYVEAGHWLDIPFDGGGDWRNTVVAFVDMTGRPGPSTWQAGNYPDGKADHPVSGVSWYEAAAYCRFRAKELPTVFHWRRAAGSILEYWESVSSAIVRSSNFGGRELAPVGQFRSLGPYGTYDMAGNAREWLWNHGSHHRWVAGGAFDEPPYVYMQAEEAPPAERPAGNGFRCMLPVQAEPADSDLRQPVTRPVVDFAAMEPLGDSAYEVLAQQLDYRATTIVPRVEQAGSSNPAWTVERITLPTGYDTNSFAVQLFLPKDRPSRPGVIFYMPHVGEFTAPVTTRTDGFDPTAGGIPFDFLLKSGWALAVVAFDGAFERQWSAERKQSMSTIDGNRLRLRHWREELGRTIDYLATRDDIDTRKLGWFGISYGAGSMLPLLAVEGRIGAAVLYSGGMRSLLPASEQPYNYLPRVTQPVLMLNGRWDSLFPLDGQQRMFELLGSPADRKKHMLFEAGHGYLPRFQVEKETLEWFDRHLAILPATPPAPLIHASPRQVAAND